MFINTTHHHRFSTLFCCCCAYRKQLIYIFSCDKIINVQLLLWTLFHSPASFCHTPPPTNLHHQTNNLLVRSFFLLPAWRDLEFFIYVYDVPNATNPLIQAMFIIFDDKNSIAGKSDGDKEYEDGAIWKLASNSSHIRCSRVFLL